LFGLENLDPSVSSALTILKISWSNDCVKATNRKDDGGKHCEEELDDLNSVGVYPNAIKLKNTSIYN
jgi:hypothetical protein